MMYQKLMGKKTAYVAMALVAASATALLVTPPPAQAHKHRVGTVTLSEGNSGKKTALRVGDALVVRLQSNVTTGYSWKITGLEPRGVVVPSGKPEYVSPRQAPGMVGAGGTQVFRFKANKAGKAELRLEYRGPGRDAHKGPPAQTFGATLIVGA